MSNLPNPFEEEAETKWPKEFAESQAKLAQFSGEEMEAIFEEGSNITLGLAQAFQEGYSAESEKVHNLIGRHHQWICNFWTPNTESYIGLGQLYVEDARFREHYDEYAAGLASFIAQAIEEYAHSSLT